MTTSVMPHVDLETLLRCGSSGDGKIVCESLFPDHLAEAAAATGPSGDLPADSFRLPRQDQLDWLDRHGQSFFDRSQSTKANHLNSSAGLHSSGHSQRLPLKKSTGSFVFFKLPDSGDLSRNSHRRHNSRFIPRPSGRAIVPPFTEPASPKVTCIGRVRSIRERSLHRKKSKRDTVEAKRVAKKSSFWSPIVAIFRFRHLRSRRGGARRDAESNVETFAAGESTDEEAGRVSCAGSATEAGPAPGLGGLKKFSSGRRSWGGGEDEAELNAQIEQVEASDPGPVWRRRAVVPPRAVECERDWESVGPVTV